MPARRFATILAVVFALGIAALAEDQSADGKNELAGSLGRIFISDQGIQGATFFNPYIRSGKGLTFEVNYCRRLLDRPIYGLSVEVPVVFNLDEDLNSGSNVVPSDYQQIFMTPSARVNFFPHTGISPWVSFGGGFGHFSENKNLLYGGPNPGESSTSGVVQGGFGLDVRPSKTHVRWLRVRGEVRDFWSGEPSFPLAPTGKTRQHNYLVGGGAVLRF
jgi:hypothetical protein